MKFNVNFQGDVKESTSLSKLKNFIRTPNWFKRNETFLFHVSLFVLLQSLVVTGYLNSINTTIERRYKFTTSEIGLLYISYEFASVPGTILFSFIGHRINRPKAIGVFGLVFALGVFLFTVPYFSGGPYSLKACENNSSKSLCSNVTAALTCIMYPSDKWALSIFCVSMFLLGLGNCPLYVLGPTYLWDNLTVRMYSIYSSIFYICLAIGPPMGFLLGGLCLSVFIDVPRTTSCYNLNTQHSLWLGAWWLGLIIFGSLVVIVVIPLIKFPSSNLPIAIEVLPKQNNVQPLRFHPMPEINQDKQSYSSFHDENKNSLFSKKSCKEIIEKLGRLFGNRNWCLVTLFIVVEQSVVLACVLYISKYLQVIYGISVDHASFVIGGLVIPGAVLGVVVGGLLMHRFQPSFITTNKVMFVLAIITSSTVVGVLFLRCDNINHYFLQDKLEPHSTLEEQVLLQECNRHCSCSLTMYEPVCDTISKRNFYSPCHAGCVLYHPRPSLSIRNLTDGDPYFSDCKCSSSLLVHTGRCNSQCIEYYFALVLLGFQIFLTATAQIPVNIMTLCIVPPELSSMALGVQIFFIHVLACMPVPLGFGALFDISCLLWVHDKCQSGSVCNEYDIDRLPYTWLGTVLTLKLLSMLLCILSYIFARKNPRLKASMSKGEIYSRATVTEK